MKPLPTSDQITGGAPFPKRKPQAKQTPADLPEGVKLITDREVAGQLSITLAAFRQMRAAGKFTCPGYKIGRGMKYNPVDVKNWIKSKLVTD